MSLIGETASKSAGDLIKDGADATFVADVVETSKTTPVIVDFWAPWCGPCRQLGPAIEKAVLEAKGAVKLVKIDIDKHPAFAGQLRVQSIPAVFAFVDGQPVDGFMGALPASEVKAFVDRLAARGDGGGAGAAVEDLLVIAKEALDQGDLGGAGQAYAEVLQADPENVKAIGGLAKVYLGAGDAERAAEVAAAAPADARDPDLESVRAALVLAQQAPSETSGFEARLAADANDHEARFELSRSLAAHGRWDEAADHLLQIIAADRAWNDDAARKQLLTIFEAAGPGSDVTRSGRRRLSSILFS